MAAVLYRPPYCWLVTHDGKRLRPVGLEFFPPEPKGEDGLIPSQRIDVELHSHERPAAVGRTCVGAALFPTEYPLHFLLARFLIVRDTFSVREWAPVTVVWQLHTTGPFLWLPPLDEDWHAKMDPLDPLWHGVYADYLEERGRDAGPYRRAAELLARWRP